MLKIASWNVNGLRAVLTRDNLNWIKDYDIIGVQESKLSDKLASDLLGFNVFYSLAQKKGYSGVTLFTKIPPVDVCASFTKTGYKDSEGRILKTYFKDFLLYNIYFPNGKKDNDRLKFKLDFYEVLLAELVLELKSNPNIIIMGDFNTAHKPIDLARPKDNESVSGFLIEERILIDRILDLGFTDTFRHFNQEPNHYTWWHLRTNARSRNVGWRIDYIMTSHSLTQSLTDAAILSDVMGSDHCPVTLDLKL